MASVMEMQMSSQSVSSHQSRNPANIRYSDVANYVGLSLTRDPSQMRSTPKRQHSVPTLSKSPPEAPSPKEEPMPEQGRGEMLPTIQANRSDRLRCQLEWLKAEQRAEKDQLRRLEGSLSDSMLLEKKAQKRVMKHKEMRDFHDQRVRDVETKIGKLKGELEAQHVVAKAPRPNPKALAFEKRAMGGSPRPEASRREDSPQKAEPAEASLQKAEAVLPPLEAEMEDSLLSKGSEKPESTENSRQISPTNRGGRAGGHHAGDADAPVPRRRRTAKALDSSELTQSPDDVQYSDEDCEGAIDVKHRSGPNTPLVARPSVGGSWVKQYLNVENSSTQRFAKWQPSNPDEKIQMLLEAAQLRSEGAAKKKWMSSTFRRLKTRGKSDARCREVVALHLPRGSGPKDREDVPIFSQNEVRTCKKMYTDSYMDPVKRIQKVIVDMKDQKRELRAVREDLFMVTEARLLQQRAEEDRKNVAANFSGLGMLGKVKDPLVDAGSEAASPSAASPANNGKKSFKKLAEENSMEEDAVTELFREYLKFADSSEMLGRKAFTRLLQALCPSRTLVESDLDAWWGQVTRSSQDAKNPANARRTQCKFEEFVVWYSTSEART